EPAANKWRECLQSIQQDASFLLNDIMLMVNRQKSMGETKSGCKWDNFKKLVGGEVEAFKKKMIAKVDGYIQDAQKFIHDEVKPLLKNFAKQEVASALGEVKGKATTWIKDKISNLVSRAVNAISAKVVSTSTKARGAAWVCGMLQTAIAALCTPG